MIAENLASSKPPALISVIISFRNEQDNIPAVVQRLAAVFEKLPERLEMVFVNDDSSDRSLEILQELRAKDDRVKIVNMARRFGVSECVLAGIERSHGDAVVYLDCDLQDPPEVIPRMIEEWRQGAKVVHTVRQKRLGENPAKMFLTRMAYRAIQLGSNIQLPVDCGDFKLLDRLVAQHMLALPESDPYIRGLAIWIGYKQVFISYIREARHSGRTHFPLLSQNPWRVLLGGITSFSFMPIYVLGLLAAVALGVSGAVAIGTGLAWLAGAGSSYGLAFLIALGLVLWATLLLAITTVGLYVVRTYKDVRGRPRYIIDHTIGL
jgi:glycosyltransferase involved in cell wall biosynthesis